MHVRTKYLTENVETRMNQKKHPKDQKKKSEGSSPRNKMVKNGPKKYQEIIKKETFFSVFFSPEN